jgi:hypothetical protein
MKRSAAALDWKLYGALWLVMMAIRQDFWLWNDSRLLFGVLPVGLAWQAGYSILAALVMWGLVTFAWPAELEDLEEPPS